MRTHIARWGNSLALRIPRRLADGSALGEGGAWSFRWSKIGSWCVPGPRRLDALLAGITPENLPASFDDAPAARSALVAAPDRGDLVWLDFAPQAGHEQNPL